MKAKITWLAASASLGACGEAPRNLEPVRVVVKVKSPESRSGLVSPQRLPDDYCYALNVTGEAGALKPVAPSGESCAVGSPDLGLVKGLYKVGDEVALEIPVGRARFDLIGFPRNGDCSGAFAARALAPGRFVATLKGVEGSVPAKLIATQVANVQAGTQTVQLDPQSQGGVVGVDYACTGASISLASVSMGDGKTLVVNGANLLGAVKARLVSAGGDAKPLSIVAKSANALTVAAGEAISVALGAVYNLVIEDARGQTVSTTVNFVVAPGSLTPAALDPNAAWPFTRVTERIASITPSIPASLASAGAVLSDWNLAMDRNLATGANLIVPPGLSANATTGGTVVMTLNLGAPTPGTALGLIRLEPITTPVTSSANCKVVAVDTPSAMYGTDLGAYASLVYDNNSGDYAASADVRFRASFFQPYINVVCSNYSSGNLRFVIRELSIRAESFP